MLSDCVIFVSVMNYLYVNLNVTWFDLLNHHHIFSVLHGGAFFRFSRIVFGSFGIGRPVGCRPGVVRVRGIFCVTFITFGFVNSYVTSIFIGNFCLFFILEVGIAVSQIILVTSSQNLASFFLSPAPEEQSYHCTHFVVDSDYP